MKYHLYLCFHFHFLHQRHFVQPMMKRHKKVILHPDTRLESLCYLCLPHPQYTFPRFALRPNKGCSRWQVGKHFHAIIIGIEQINIQLARKICDFFVLDTVTWLKVLMVDNRSNFLPLCIFHENFILQNSRCFESINGILDWQVITFNRYRWIFNYILYDICILLNTMLNFCGVTTFRFQLSLDTWISPIFLSLKHLSPFLLDMLVQHNLLSQEIYSESYRFFRFYLVLWNENQECSYFHLYSHRLASKALATYEF